MKKFRKTWRHEVIIEAETKEEAESLWEGLNLGRLDQYEEDTEILSHEYVESISFEEED